MFEINGISWDIVWVNPNNRNLMRSDDTITVGMTDFNTKCVYLSNVLYGAFLRKVMAHELVHCFCFSYDVYMPIQEEERLADWVATYGTELIYLLDDIIKILKKAI
jgi:hypothetical protein